MKRLALIATLAVTIATTGSAAASPKPSCHWTHHKAGAVNVYVQICTVAKHRKHRVDPRWTHAGPRNSAAPRIG